MDTTSILADKAAPVEGWVVIRLKQYHNGDFIRPYPEWILAHFEPESEHGAGTFLTQEGRERFGIDEVYDWIQLPNPYK